MANERDARDEQPRHENHDRQLGPVRPKIIEELERDREDIRDQASYQARPKIDMPERAAEKPGEAAKASAEAAGTEHPKRENAPSLQASERAFQQSEGSRAPRPSPGKGGH